MSIRRLPPEVTAKLRSGVAISTVAQCVEELVLNSLDAGATCVAVRLDLTFYKIQVVDNGRGMSREDLNLVGERYVTSKCRTVQDVDSTQTYGHRGEALASIGEVSQELTIASKTNEQQVTYVKSVGGSRTSVQKASVQRPAAGTTITVLNFLHNMPVRQLAISSLLDVETVRRNLEVHALGHPGVSFSLHDDVSATWCLRVSRTCSMVKTFGQLFGSSWVSLLRGINDSRGPFGLHGQVALKGYHNKNRQYLFVDRRRVVDDRLQKTIDDVFNGFRSNRSSFMSDLHPVYVLHLECPRDQYDIGFHPSKLLVEFRQFDLLQALVGDTFRRLLEEHVPQHAGQQSTSSETEDALPVPQELVIAVQDYRNSLHSLPAKRPFKPATVITHEPEVTLSSSSRSSASSSEPDRCLLFLPKKKSRFVEKPVPIVLSRTIGTTPTVLGRVMKISKDERERRTLAAIAELQQRYARNTHSSTSRKDDRHRRRHGDAGPGHGKSQTVPASTSISERPTAFPQGTVAASVTVDNDDDSSAGPLRLPNDGTSAEQAMSVDKTTASTTSRDWIGGICLTDAASNGDSQHFGRPEDQLSLVSDLFPAASDDSKLAASQLPYRPWRSKERDENVRLTEEATLETSRPQSSSSVLKLYQNWENPILTSGSGSLHLKMPVIKQCSLMSGDVAAVAHSYVFSPAILQDLLLIGQVDCKFIVCAVPYSEIPELESRPSEPNLIAVFDQHAVHERIRLELLLQEAGFNHDGVDGADTKRQPSTSCVNPPLKVGLPVEVAFLAVEHRVRLAQLVGVTVSEADEAAADMENVDVEHRMKDLWIHSLPSCLLEREASELRQKRPSVIGSLAQDLIMEIIEDLMLHRGFRTRMPKVVLNVLKSQACHGALKFGDRLDAATCNDLLVRLGKCLLPFQCAHGRPSVTALADLRRMPRPKQISKPNLFRLKRAMTEHLSLQQQTNRTPMF